jgi:hypothetical protein
MLPQLVAGRARFCVWGWEFGVGCPRNEQKKMLGSLGLSLFLSLPVLSPVELSDGRAKAVGGGGRGAKSHERETA